MHKIDMESYGFSQPHPGLWCYAYTDSRTFLGVYYPVKIGVGSKPCCSLPSVRKIVEKVVAIYKVYFKDKNGVMRVSLVNDPGEIKPPNKIVKVENNRPNGCFKCC